MKKTTPKSAAAKSENRPAARFLARFMWTATFRAQNPDATDEQLQAAWQDAKKEQVKLARTALRKMERSGDITLHPRAEGEADSAEDKAA